jgi:hypothetical protein
MNEKIQQLLNKAKENKETLMKIGGVLLGAALGVAGTVLVGKMQESSTDDVLQGILDEQA